MKSKSPKAPTVAAPVPVPQTDDPTLIDVKRGVRANAMEREGSRASLLTPGGSRGASGSGGTKRSRLGYGALASGA
jgi:hypothetical protein